ncbi:SPOSA6832_01704, partial [Sporobolomyces salmonicolor]
MKNSIDAHLLPPADQFSGIAIRMATDLNLHRKTIAQLPPDISDDTRVLYERELLNRERAWLYSFICDRSVSTQMGKPYSIPKEDYIIRSASTWHTQPGALPSDAGLSAMVEMHRIVGRMIDVLYSDTRSVSGLNAHLDYPLLMRAFLQQLDQWRSDWGDEMAYRDQDEPSRRIRSQMRDPGSAIDLPGYCVLCFEAAERMISILRDFLGPAGILRYAMDSTFVYASYAAVFLLKLVSPTFASFIDEDAAMRLVRETAETLEKSAVDDQHTPALYGAFLRALIDNKLHGPRTAANSRAPTRPGSPNLAMPSSAGLSYTLTGGNSIGLESFLRSRATSPAPPAFPGDLPAFGFGAGEGEMGDAAVHDALTMDSMLSDGGFWSQMLMPGFGGPLASLSGGTGTVFAGNPADPFSMTPFHSRPASPTQHAFPPTFDFHLPSSSSSTGGGGADYGLPSVHAPAPAEPTTTTNGSSAASAPAADADGDRDGDGEVHFALPQATPLSGGGGASAEGQGHGQGQGQGKADGSAAVGKDQDKDRDEPATNGTGTGNGNGETADSTAVAEDEVKPDGTFES